MLAPGDAKAPGFALVTTGLEQDADGPELVVLEAWSDRVVVLEFMAVACEPCRAVSEGLRPVWEEHKGNPRFAMLAIDTWADSDVPGWQPGWETAERLAALQVQTGATWPHALDTDDVWRKYDAVALPKVAVLDSGRIVMQAQGEIDVHRVAHRVTALLATK
jgi:thiol-disulfide isomerase/thioredoxin